MASTRDRIIVATNELFRRAGYNATSLSQISEASSATIGSIYHFFPGGKEALAVAVVEATGGVYRDLFVAVAADAASPADAYVDFFDGAAEALAASDFIDPCPIGGIAREVANSSEPLRLAAGRAFQSWIDAATAHLVDAGIDRQAAGSLATVFVATIEGTFVLARTLRDPAPLHLAGRQLAMLVEQARTASVAPAGR